MHAQERWHLVEQIFHDALLRPTAERQAFVESSCGDDAGLRQEVESLLAADSSRDSRAVLPGMVAADWVSTIAPDAMTGREIGGYRVVSLPRRGRHGRGRARRDCAENVRAMPLQILEVRPENGR